MSSFPNPPYIIMHYKEKDLMKYYNDNHTIDISIIQNILDQIFEVLRWLISKNLYYTDIKLENFVIDTNNNEIKIYIIDLESIILSYNNINKEFKYSITYTWPNDPNGNQYFIDKLNMSKEEFYNSTTKENIIKFMKCALEFIIYNLFSKLPKANDNTKIINNKYIEKCQNLFKI